MNTSFTDSGSALGLGALIDICLQPTGKRRNCVRENKGLFECIHGATLNRAGHRIFESVTVNCGYAS